MRARSIGHASLEIDVAGLRLLSNPWWEGPAHNGQWHQWPTPRPAQVHTRHIDYLFLSSGQDEHFHLPTLRTLRAGSTVLLPDFLQNRLGPHLRQELGISRVIVMRHGRTIKLRRNLKATCYINLDRAILVLEHGEQVWVDMGHALNGAPAVVIDYFCRMLRYRHPSIDTLFLSHRSASWFPNCIRLPGKDDRAVAIAREQLQTDNFLRIVDHLRPKLACANGASFVLLEAHNHWINEVRLSSLCLESERVQRKLAPGSVCHVLLPNDLIDGHELIPGASQKPSLEAFEAALRNELREAMETASHLPQVSPDQLRDLMIRLDARAKAFRPQLGQLRPFTLEVWLRNNSGACLRLEVSSHSAQAALGPATGPAIRLECSAELLDKVLRKPENVDAVISGYGGVASISRPEDLVYVNTALALLGAGRDGLKASVRAYRGRPFSLAHAIWSQRWPLALHIGARVGLLSHPFELRPLEHPLSPSRQAA